MGPINHFSQRGPNIGAGARLGAAGAQIRAAGAGPRPTLSPDVDFLFSSVSSDN